MNGVNLSWSAQPSSAQVGEFRVAYIDLRGCLRRQGFELGRKSTTAVLKESLTRLGGSGYVAAPPSCLNTRFHPMCAVFK